MHDVCPGARLFREPKPEIFKCPYCGEEVEIWTDEIKAVCPNCKKTVFKDQNLSCLEWCKFAKECIGENAYKTYIMNRNITIKKKLLTEIINYFGNDTKYINHAKNVLKFSEDLLAKENGDWHIVIPAAILHDVGKKNEKIYNSYKNEYQEKEPLPVVKKILLKLGIRLEDIEEICKIIAYHNASEIINTNNFKIFHDADKLVSIKINLRNEYKTDLKERINKSFLTNSGKKLAKELYLSKNKQL